MIFNKEDDIIDISFGNINKILDSKYKGFPLPNIMYRNNRLFETKRALTWAKNKNFEKYIGWYMREITRDCYFECLKEKSNV